MSKITRIYGGDKDELPLRLTHRIRKEKKLSPYAAAIFVFICSLVMVGIGLFNDYNAGEITLGNGLLVVLGLYLLTQTENMVAKIKARHDG